MSKRRTREQKIKAQNKHRTNFGSFSAEINEASNTPVKSYFTKEKSAEKDKKVLNHNPVDTEQTLFLKLIKKDLIKSILVSSFILCLIVVLYLAWYK